MIYLFTETTGCGNKIIKGFGINIVYRIVRVGISVSIQILSDAVSKFRYRRIQHRNTINDKTRFSLKPHNP